MTDQPTDLPPPPAIDPPPAGKSGGLRAVVVVGLILAFLGVVLFITRDAGSAGDLKVGDCFDVPTADTFSTVTHHPCTEPHGAEVFHVVEFSGSDMTTPLTFVIDGFVETECVPAFATYTGIEFDPDADLTFGWFYPSVERWQGGDRTITCYITMQDDSSMSASVRAAP